MRSRVVFAASLLIAVLGGGALLLSVLRPVAIAPGASADTLTPNPVLPVRATIRSVIVLQGAIVPVTHVDVRAPAAGSVIKVVVAVSTEVAAGQVIVQLKAGRTTIDVPSPDDGVIVEIPVTVGEDVARGELLATLAPRRFMVEAVVDPALLYRLYQPPIEISAQIDRGPAAFACPFGSLGARDVSGDPLAAPVYLTCSVPPSIRAFAGVRVKVVVTTGIAEHALLVPVQAVEGSADRGVVWVVESNGMAQARQVRLGLTDGVRVQILSGLTDSERILEFPPSDGADIETPLSP